MTHPFEISMRNPEFVKVRNTTCDLGKLWVATIRM
jgi:hypothetical protein